MSAPAGLDPTSTALIVVDVQNGFSHPAGTRSRAVGPAAARPTQAIVPVIVDLIAVLRATGVSVWFTQQQYWADDKAYRARRIRTGLDRTGSTLDVCRAGSWDVELVAELEEVRAPEDHVIVKHRASAFYQTELEQQLRMRGVDTLIVTGTTTSYCVEATVRDAHARDYDVVVPAEAVADTDTDAQRASLAVIERFHGLVCTIDDVVAMLTAAR